MIHREAEEDETEVLVNVNDLAKAVAREVVHQSGGQQEKIRKTKRLLSHYRRLRKMQQEESAQFTDAEKVDLRWRFVQDLMGTVHEDRPQSIIDAEERRRAENQFYFDRITSAVEQYRQECEDEGTPQSLRRYRELCAYYIDGPRKPTYEQIADEEQVTVRTVISDLGAAAEVLAVYILGI